MPSRYCSGFLRRPGRRLRIAAFALAALMPAARVVAQDRACAPPTALNPTGTISAEGGTVTLSWSSVGAARYNVRLEDGTQDRHDDPRFTTCESSPHYYCENGVRGTSIEGVPVKSGRAYTFWVDPVFDPPREYCNGGTQFTVGAAPPALACDQIGSGAFAGCYYQGQSFDELKLTRTDAYPLTFDWGVDAPGPDVPADGFSARWQGDFTFESGDYEFSATADDGVRLYLDDGVVIDQWRDQGATTYKANRTLVAGSHRVKVEYYENGGAAVAKLSWLKLAPPGQSCIPSGNQAAIQAALTGPGAAAVLCPNAVFELSGPVVFSADNQAIYTEGLPGGESRAVLRIVQPSLATAIDGGQRSGIQIKALVIDGGRATLGPIAGGGALIGLGGNALGQLVEGVKAYEPRGWSVLHLYEGDINSGGCSGAVVAGNELGPAGQPDGTWADGISLACRNSTVSGNTITDATDGAIVVFGAPGSLVSGNTIIAATRLLLGGINMVDHGPFGGDYTGTVVTGNRIEASGAPIKVGIAMGPRAWSSWCGQDLVNRNGTVTNNVLAGARMGYGFAADGVSGWTVTGNVSEATHSGTAGPGCGGTPLSSPAAFQRYAARTSGTFQSEFAEARLDNVLNIRFDGKPPCLAPAALAPTGAVEAPGGAVTLSWSDVGAVHYDVRLEDGTQDRHDDPRFSTCESSPHYYCENGVRGTSIEGVPVKDGRAYAFWVDPVFDPPREYCNGGTKFIVQTGLPPAAPTVAASCANGKAVATLSWASTGHEVIVDVDHDGDWANGFWNKAVPAGATKTAAPDGFNRHGGARGALELSHGVSYAARVYDAATGQHSPPTSFQVPVCGETIADTLQYFLTDHSEVGLTGGHHLGQTVIGDRAYSVKWDPEVYEVHEWDEQYLYLREDHNSKASDCGGEPKTYTWRPGEWMKRRMAVGESVIPPNTDYSWYHCDCKVASSGSFPNARKNTLEAHYPAYDLGGELGVQDVIVLRYRYNDDSGHEKFYYSKEWGWVKWELYQWNEATGDYHRQQEVVFNRKMPKIGPDIAASCSGPGAPTLTAACEADPNVWRPIPGGGSSPSQPVGVFIPAGKNTQFANSVGVAVRGVDDAVYTQGYSLAGEAWAGSWTPLGPDTGRTREPPATFVGDAWDVLIRGLSGNTLHAINWSSGWTAWVDKGKLEASFGGPVSTVDSTGRLWAFRKGAGDAIEYHCSPPKPPASAPQASKLVLSFYYPWYGAPEGPSKAWVHWDPNAPGCAATHKPSSTFQGLGYVGSGNCSGGYYDSKDDRVIGQHIAWAQAAGIDAFIASWWGQGGFEDQAFQEMLKVAESKGFKLTLYYEDAPSREQVLADFRYIRDRYGSSPAFLKVEGKPVIFVYGRAVGQISLLDWDWVQYTLRAEGGPVFTMGDGLGSEAAWAFDGIHTYNVAGQTVDAVRQSYQGASALAAQNGRLFAATVIPGYDDTVIRSPGLTQDRLGGQLYQDLWAAAAASNPQWVLITSFNEWHEGSEIEPSAEFGNQYLTLTAEPAFTFKGLAPPLPAPPSCVAPTGLNPTGTISAEGGTVTLSWSDVGAAHYDVRLDDGSSDRYDDARFSTCENSPHYYCENGIAATSVTGVPVTAGRTYSFWVDPVFDPAREYCNGGTQFTVAPPTVPAPSVDASCASPSEFVSHFFLDGATPSTAAVQALADGRLVVAVRGKDDGVWSREWMNGQNLTGWVSLAGATTAPPKLVVEGGTPAIYVQGLDGFVYRKWRLAQGSWSSEWENTQAPNSGFGAAGPSAVSTAYGTFRVAGYNPVRLERCQEPLPEDPAAYGQWGPVMTWPIVGSHMALLRTGKVLVMDYTEPAGEENSELHRRDIAPKVWDPGTAEFQETDIAALGQDPFCSGFAALADGTILMAGGGGAVATLEAKEAYRFNPDSLVWTPAASMAYSRWYPTLTSLGDGRILAVGGDAEHVHDAPAVVADIPEIYDPAADAWTALPGAQQPFGETYPQMFLLPDGRLLQAGPNATSRVLDLAASAWTPLESGSVSSIFAANYDRGKFLRTSGSGTETVDFNGPAPAWVETGRNLVPRAHSANMVVLPDGGILLAGGQASHDTPAGQAGEHAVRHAEIFDPALGAWSSAAKENQDRVYHSASMLLPDGRVLSAGGDDAGGHEPYQWTAQVYSPPYLFRGARPEILEAPAEMAYGRPFSIQASGTEGGVSVVLMRPGSRTHWHDFDQRRLRLTHVALGGGGLLVQAPADPSEAPPGYYMVFLLNGNGVPSVARFLRLTQASAIESASVEQCTTGSNALVVEAERVECLSVPGDGYSFRTSSFPLAGMAGKSLHLYLSADTVDCVHDHVLQFFDAAENLVASSEEHPYQCGEGACTTQAFIETIQSHYDHASLYLRRTYLCRGPSNETLHWVVASGSGAPEPDWSQGRFQCQGETGCASAAPPPDSSTQAAKPNIVVILANHLSREDVDTLLAAGLMPNLQSYLAAAGTDFRNAFVSNTFGGPSRATLLTGRYPHNHGVRTNFPPLGGVEAFDDGSTLATWLQEAGYKTGFVGKYLNGYGLESPPFVPPGYDDWTAISSREPEMYGYTLYTLHAHDPAAQPESVTYGSAPEDYQTDVLAGRAADLIREWDESADASPNLLVVSLMAVHPDYLGAQEAGLLAWEARMLPPPRYEGQCSGFTARLAKPSFNEADVSDKPATLRILPPLTEENVDAVTQQYQDVLCAARAIDDLIGTVAAALEERGELEGTALIFTGDHGIFLGEHRVANSGPGYEEAIRVPLYIRLPAASSGQVTERLAVNTDLAPTVAALAQVALPYEPDGRSLLPVLEDPELEPAAWRRRFLVESWLSPPGSTATLPTIGVWEAGDPAAGLGPKAYFEWSIASSSVAATVSKELYDLSADSFQLTSLHQDAALADERLTLNAWLRSLKACQGAGCQELEAAASPALQVEPVEAVDEAALAIAAPLGAPALAAPAEQAAGVGATPAFAWSDVSGETGQSLQLSEDSSFSWYWSAALPQDTTGAVWPAWDAANAGGRAALAALKGSGTYFWRVMAHSSAGSSSSSVGSFTTAALPSLVLCASSTWTTESLAPDAVLYRCAQYCPAQDGSQCVVDDTALDAWGRPLKRLAFTVDGMGGEIRWNLPHPSSGVLAGMFFHAGLGGTAWGDSYLSTASLYRLQQDGLVIAAVRWEEGRSPSLASPIATGWFTHRDATASTLVDKSRRPGAVMAWVRERIVPAGAKLGTAGCSGGSIATFSPVYWHGLDAAVDYQYLSGGPFVWDVWAACRREVRPVGGLCENDPGQSCSSDADCDSPADRCAMAGGLWTKTGVIDYITRSSDCRKGVYNPAFDSSSYRSVPGDASFDHPVDFDVGEGAELGPAALSLEDGDTTAGITWQSGQVFLASTSPAKAWVDHEGAKHCSGLQDDAYGDELRGRILAGLGLAPGADRATPTGPDSGPLAGVIDPTVPLQGKMHDVKIELDEAGEPELVYSVDMNPPWVRVRKPVAGDMRTVFRGGLLWGNDAHLHHNPFNPGEAFLSWTDSNLRVNRSEDGGATWPESARDPLGTGTGLVYHEPNIACRAAQDCLLVTLHQAARGATPQLVAGRWDGYTWCRAELPEDWTDNTFGFVAPSAEGYLIAGWKGGAAGESSVASPLFALPVTATGPGCGGLSYGPKTLIGDAWELVKNPSGMGEAVISGALSLLYNAVAGAHWVHYQRLEEGKLLQAVRASTDGGKSWGAEYGQEGFLGSLSLDPVTSEPYLFYYKPVGPPAYQGCYRKGPAWSTEPSELSAELCPTPVVRANASGPTVLANYYEAGAARGGTVGMVYMDCGEAGCTGRYVVAPGSATAGSAPALRVLSPEDGSTVSGSVDVEVEASDPAGIARVEVRVDGKLLGAARQPPWRFRWDALGWKSSRLTLTATAYSRSGGRSSAAVEVTAAGRSPDVVVLMMDDVDELTFQTAVDRGWMPNFQEHIAGSGVTFKNSFVAYSLCCPSRAIFLTGQYPHNNGVRGNSEQGGGGCTALKDAETLATWLKASGYRTGHVGKYLNLYGSRPDSPRGACTNPRYVPPGWDDWQGLVDPSTYLMYRYLVNDNGRPAYHGASPEDYQTDVLARRALDFIAESTATHAGPLFLAVTPLAAHIEGALAGCQTNYGSQLTIRAAPRHEGSAAALALPRGPAFNEADVTDKPPWVQGLDALTPEGEACLERIFRDRVESLRAVDDMIGRVVAALKSAGRWENTLFILTSDNGYLNGEHRLAYKVHPYEESIRVPLVIRPPGGAAARVAEQMAANTDLAPTIVDYASATARITMDGSSLKPVLESPSATWRRRLLIQFYDGSEDTGGIVSAGAAEERFRELQENPLATLPQRLKDGHAIPASYLMLRAGPLDATAPETAYVAYEDGTIEYYDLATDPKQLENRQADPTTFARQDALDGWLAALNSCVGDSCRAAEFGDAPSAAPPGEPTVLLSAVSVAGGILGDDIRGIGALSGPVILAADPRPASRAREVEFRVDGKLRRADRRPPFVFRWDTRQDADGKHAVTVRSRDSRGRVAERQVFVELRNGVAARTDAEARTTAADLEPPASPVLVSLAALGTAEAELSWSASTDNVRVGGYRVDAALDSAFSRWTWYQDQDAGRGTAYRLKGLRADTLYHVRLRAVDGAGNASATSPPMSVRTAPPRELFEAAIEDPERGGRVRHEALRAEVAVPSLALAEPVAITIEDLGARRGASAAALPEPPAGAARAGPLLRFGPEGLAFDRPATLTLPYEGNAGAAMFHFDENAREWRRVAGSSADPASKTVSAPVSHFSIYAAMAEATGQAAVQVLDAFVFPNPVRGSALATLRVDAGGIADRIEARVYNLAGDSVEAFEFGAPTLLDGRFVYERVWAPAAPSGVYAFVVRAHRGGQASAPKSGRFAVIR